ncbi:MAG: hypothetical protein ABTQ25_03865, partial [Nitrosomonas ureae]
LMKAIFISLLFCLMINNANALSIIYDGFKCTDDSTVLGEPAQSKFTVEQDLGNGSYRLLLEGGYLYFPDGKICLKLIETSDPETYGDLSNIKATAYFNGTVLVISYGLLFENKEYVPGNPISINDISFFPSTYNLVFDYSSTTQTFKLVSATELNNAYATQGLLDARYFSLIHVRPILPAEEIQYLISE